MKHVVHAQLRRISHRATRVIGRRGTPGGPIWTVSEYPKSGGTWFGKMLADCLRLPYPAPSIFPVAFPAVVHNHWDWDPGRRHAFYLFRDGRDVMVSYWFHRMRRLAQGEPNTVRLFAARYRRLFGPGWDHDDTARFLPRFIEEEFRRPRGARLSWSDHVRSWHRPAARRDVCFLSYESLLEDALGTMARCVEHATRREADPWIVATAVEKWSMARMTGGRKRGEEDRGAFVRKGVAGDWRTHFTREAAEVFDDLAGETLVMLGYERDRSWVDAVGLPEIEVTADGGRARRSLPAPARIRPTASGRRSDRPFGPASH